MRSERIGAREDKSMIRDIEEKIDEMYSNLNNSVLVKLSFLICVIFIINRLKLDRLVNKRFVMIILTIIVWSIDMEEESSFKNVARTILDWLLALSLTAADSDVILVAYANY